MPARPPAWEAPVPALSCLQRKVAMFEFSRRVGIVSAGMLLLALGLT